MSTLLSSLVCLLISFSTGQRHPRVQDASPRRREVQWENNGHRFSLTSAWSEYYEPSAPRRNAPLFFSRHTLPRSQRGVTRGHGGHTRDSAPRAASSSIFSESQSSQNLPSPVLEITPPTQPSPRSTDAPEPPRTTAAAGQSLFRRADGRIADPQSATSPSPVALYFYNRANVPQQAEQSRASAGPAEDQPNTSGNSVFYDLYPATGRSRQLNRGSGYGTRYFHHGKSFLNTIINTKPAL